MISLKLKSKFKMSDNMENKEYRIAWFDPKGETFTYEICNKSNEKGLISHILGRDKKLWSENIDNNEQFFQTQNNNNVSRRHARIYLYKPFDSSKNIQEDPYWAIEHISEKPDIETVIFEGDFMNKTQLKPGRRYKLPLDNINKLCGIYLGKLDGRENEGVVLDFGEVDTGSNLIDGELDYSKLTSVKVNFDPFKGELNGIHISSILSKVEKVVFDIVSKRGDIKNPVSIEQIAEVHPDYEGHGNKSYFKGSLFKANVRQIKYMINKKLDEKVNSKGKSKIKIEGKHGFYIEITENN